jgi:hypothetical protein
LAVLVRFFFFARMVVGGSTIRFVEPFAPRAFFFFFFDAVATCGWEELLIASVR